MRWMLDPNNSPFGMKISLDPTYLSWLIQFAMACSEANVQRAIPPLNALGQLSSANFARLVADEKFDCHYQQTGLLFLFKTKEALDGGKDEAETLHQYGLPTEVLDKEAVHQREPGALPDVIGGVHFTGDASLNPARFLELLAKRVRDLGAEVYENTPVTGFEIRDKKISHCTKC